MKCEHWERKEWPIRDQLNVGEKNIINEPLVDKNRIVFPLPHIKLGLIKQFVKTLDKQGDCFDYIHRLYPWLSDKKLKLVFLMDLK